MLDSMEKTHKGVDKIDHYKWVVKDKKGSFQVRRFECPYGGGTSLSA